MPAAHTDTLIRLVLSKFSFSLFLSLTSQTDHICHITKPPEAQDTNCGVQENMPSILRELVLNMKSLIPRSPYNTPCHIHCPWMHWDAQDMTQVHKTTNTPLGWQRMEKEGTNSQILYRNWASCWDVATCHQITSACLWERRAVSMTSSLCLYWETDTLPVVPAFRSRAPPLHPKQPEVTCPRAPIVIWGLTQYSFKRQSSILTYCDLKVCHVTFWWLELPWY